MSRWPYQLHLLLGRRVASVELSAPSSFAITFTGGLALRVFAGTSGHESFSVQPGDIFV